MKRIILCSDGTWNFPDQRDRGKRKPSNVVKMVRAILPADAQGVPQVVFYDEGVGTNWGLDKYIGGITGRGLSKNILDSYLFLIHNYSEGDEIFLFGFSRGAYTIRSLAGMIGICGLLSKNDAFYVPEAYQFYRNRADEMAGNESFHLKFNTRQVKIKFIGVWDTVGALGIPLGGFLGLRLNRRFMFHDVRLGSHIENAYQALAIDERRKPFAPTLWESEGVPGQTLEQMWFAGSHTNIGGGYEMDGLANIAFQWMRKKAELLGLATDRDYTGHFKPVYYSRLRNSLTFWYKLLGAKYRPIGAGRNSFESVHPSAVERLNPSRPLEDGPYRPPNLINYLRKLGQWKD